METQQARLMDGTDLARRMTETSAAAAEDIRRRTGVSPVWRLCWWERTRPRSVTYVRMKQARCARAGIHSRHVALPATVSTSGLAEAVTALSKDPDVHGILLQHPVGPHIDERAAFEAIAPGKDVDGVNMHSFAATGFGLPGFVSCTPGGIMRLLDEDEVDLTGKHAVVVGRSPAVVAEPRPVLTAVPTFPEADQGRRHAGRRPRRTPGRPPETWPGPWPLPATTRPASPPSATAATAPGATSPTTSPRRDAHPRALRQTPARSPSRPHRCLDWTMNANPPANSPHSQTSWSRRRTAALGVPACRLRPGVDRARAQRAHQRLGRARP